MSRSTPIALLSVIVALSGCHHEPPPSSMDSSPPKEALPAAPDAGPATKPQQSAAVAAALAQVAAAQSAPDEKLEPIGIKECDDYLALWANCSKDPTKRGAVISAFQQMKAKLGAMAAKPELREKMAQSCRVQLEHFPTASCH
jgi:hypothetical protein